MFNLNLFLLFIGYFISLAIGFFISKDEINKYYHKFKLGLNILISIISLVSIYLFYLTYLELNWFKYVLLLQIVFLSYFFFFSIKESRCYKQHRMLFYHFFLIVLIYFSSLVLNSRKVQLIVIIIYIYNIAEFQFAKLNLNQCKIWD